MTIQLSEQAREDLQRLIQNALDEDHARDDVTSALAIPEDDHGAFAIRNRVQGVVCGLEAVPLTLATLGTKARCDLAVEDGVACSPGTVLARIEGQRRGILSSERTFLNLVGVLSGTASLTARFVEAAGPACTILDTRKTWPGYRRLQKYAVLCGGGSNHRMHLADGFLLKDNHRHPALQLDDLVRRARETRPGIPIVVEVDDLDQFRTAVRLPVDRVLLDNFKSDAIRAAREFRDRIGVGVGLEVSGGVDLGTAAELAAAGAEFLSVGALTHSAAVWDVGLDES